MLTRTARKLLDNNLASLIRMDPHTPAVLEELVSEIHEFPDLIPHQIIVHRYFPELVYGILRIMDAHTPKSPRTAGCAAYVLGALLEADNGKHKVITLLKDELRVEETQHCLPNLAALIEIYELEPQTNASGTTALVFEIEESRNWAFEQPSCEWLIYILSRCLHDTDMWVASNCALTLARICMCEEGRKKVLEHKESDFIISQLIMAIGVDNEGRGMNAAFALAYICDAEDGMKRIAFMKECLDMVLGLINMLRSVDEGCRKNAVFCLKTMSQWEEGQDRINDDPDIEQLLRMLCNLLTCGDEDLGKLATTTMKNLATKREGYMLQKDSVPAKTTLEHVLKQMSISESYRKDAFESLKSLMLTKPEPPVLKVVDAYTILAKWEKIEAMSGAGVMYELYCDDTVVYTGGEPNFKCHGLKERTNYEFRLRAFTDDDEESFISDGTITQTFRAVSSPPRNLRAVQVTSTQIKIVWDKPAKVCGNLKGYYVQAQGSSIHYEPVYLYHFASNLEADKEYTFQVCAVTQRGRGVVAELTVQTMKNDYFAPSKPQVMSVGTHEIVVTWKAPVAPPGRINGYEVMCNGKSIYFGMNKRCIATMLQPDTKYKFTVVAWTSEGRTESRAAYKKTSSTYKNKTRKQPWKNKDELMKWLDSKEEIDDEDEGANSDGGQSTVRSGVDESESQVEESDGSVAINNDVETENNKTFIKENEEKEDIQTGQEDQHEEGADGVHGDVQAQEKLDAQRKEEEQS